MNVGIDFDWIECRPDLIGVVICRTYWVQSSGVDGTFLILII